MENFLADGSNRALFIDSQYLLWLKLQSMGGYFKYPFLEQRILSDQMGFLWYTKDPMTNLLNRGINRLTENGLMRFYESLSLYVYKVPTEEKTKLSLNHLDVWFQFWLMFLSLATFVFFIEICFKKIRDKFRIVHIKKEKADSRKKKLRHKRKVQHKVKKHSKKKRKPRI